MPIDSISVKEIRRRLGLSQQGLAERLGVSLQTVWRWEAGLTRPLPVINAKLEELGQETPASRPRPRSIPRQGGIPVRRTSQASAIGPAESSVGGLLKGFANLMDLLSKLADQGPQGSALSGGIGTPGGSIKAVYGFSVRSGLGGMPVIQQFGNVQQTGEGAAVASTRQPLVDVLEEQGQLRVIAELPGVAQQDIQLRVEGDILHIEASGPDRSYTKEVLLPAGVNPESLKSSYRNGVLEITLAVGE